MERLPSTRYCFLRHNEKLRTAIKAKLATGIMSQSEAARRADIDAGNFRGYLSGKSPKRVTQWELIQVAKVLGIVIKLEVYYEL